MSDDLVTRLRARVVLMTASTERPEIGYGPPAVQVEAADEIERLRDLVRELRGAAEDLLPYATAAIGLPEPLWPSDSVILRARAAIEKAKEVS